MKGLAFIFIFLSSILITIAQPTIEWSEVYGGSDDDYGLCISQTSDKGYFIAGSTKSTDSIVTGNMGWRDNWLLKTNANGVLEWQKCLGGSEEDVLFDCLSNEDGGYILCGESKSSDGDLTINYGEYDLWMLEVDSAGTIIWQKSIGGSDNDGGSKIIHSKNGGYIICGATWSQTINGTPTGVQGYNDYWILETDSIGNIIWQKLYGGTYQDHAWDIMYTSDGGLICCGSTGSQDGDVSGSHGGHDGWILKMDSVGNIIWKKCYGGSLWDTFRDIEQCEDGGFIVAGETTSYDGDVSGNHGEYDVWLVKIDSLGNIERQKCFGGSGIEGDGKILQTTDGEQMLYTSTTSNDGDVSANHGSLDGWCFKIDSTWSISWQRSFGGSLYDGLMAITEISFDEYMIAGWAESSDGDLTINNGKEDLWIIKLSCTADTLIIDIADPVYCDSTSLAAIGNFHEYIWTTGDTTQSINIISGGLYGVYAYTEDGCYRYAEILAPDPAMPYDGMEICMVTYHDSLAFNTIIYEPIHNVGIDSILFYFYDTLSQVYEKMGSMHIDEAGVYKDVGSNPDIASYQYKIAIQDTFGNISDFSSYHETMLLEANNNSSNNIVLNWNPYIGFNYSEFEVYRSVEGGIMELIEGTEDTSYTDLSAPIGLLQYQIRIQKDTACNPGNGIYSYTSSNLVTLQYVGIPKESIDNLKIYPNPFNDIIIVSREDEHKHLNLEIKDIYNRSRGVFTLKPGTKTTTISTSELSSGIYLLIINERYVQRIIKY